MDKDKTLSKFEEAAKTDLDLITKEKNSIPYLPWATAWAEFKKVYPDGTFKVREDADGNMHFGNATMGYNVYTSVTANETTHNMWLPIIDYRNKAILKPSVTDVNKSVMRCLVKNISLFGTGIYLYAGTEYYEQEVIADKQSCIEYTRSMIKELVTFGKQQDALSIVKKYGAAKGDPAKIKDMEDLFTAKDEVELLLKEAKENAETKKKNNKQ